MSGALTERERIAKLEEKAESQAGFNDNICKIVDELRNHLHRIEIIAIVGLVIYGADRLAVLTGLLP